MIFLPAKKTQDVPAIVLENPVKSADPINNWNWGPLIFTVPWTMVHGFCGLTILSLLPGIGLVLGIILGIYGNELAWKKNHTKTMSYLLSNNVNGTKLGK